MINTESQKTKYGIDFTKGFKNHTLVNCKEYLECGECHIEPNQLLVYRYKDDKLILLLVATGSHSELFK